MMSLLIDTILIQCLIIKVEFKLSVYFLIELIILSLLVLSSSNFY